jgi:hypothetical protein
MDMGQKFSNTAIDMSAGINISCLHWEHWTSGRVRFQYLSSVVSSMLHAGISIILYYFPFQNLNIAYVFFKCVSRIAGSM